jgi:3-hydroxybutyryl-CoA dehydratase
MYQEGSAFDRSVRFTEEMVAAFAALTGDRAPVHVDHASAIEMGFKGRIVHGFLVSAMYSEILGCHLPGPNSVIQKVNIDLIAPVFIGDTIDFRAVVTRVTESVRAVSLSLSATNSSGTLVNRGTAVCILRNDWPAEVDTQ